MYINLKNLITFMYQDEVEDAEEVLHSFLEDAEDLNIRGLSEGNTDGLIFQIENFPQNQFIKILKHLQKGRELLKGPEGNFYS